MTDSIWDFCNSTALHGWPHLPNASSFGRIFWSVTILTNLVVALFLSSSTLTSYQEATVSTTLISKTTPVDKAKFPKIVICNKYKLRQSALDTVTSVMLNLTNDSFTRDELTLAIYNEAISGWGYIPSPQDALMKKILPLLYYVLYNKHTEDESDFVDLMNQVPDYAFSICSNDSYQCWMKLTQGQNFYSMISHLKIQGEEVDLFQEGSPVSVELTSGSNYCPSIKPDSVRFPIRSGIGNGVEVLLDLETFDNGDMLVLGDGVDILLTEPFDYALTDLMGFSAGPGSAVDVQIKPELFTTTNAALKFDYLKRKCVDVDKDKALQQMEGMTGNYSLSNCLVSATLTQIYENCPGISLLSEATGSALQCIRYHMEQIGRWSVEKSSGMSCLSSCTRQENPISTSTYKFPNKMFLNSPDFLLLVKKLAVYCQNETTHYGPKRPLLDTEYPLLCPFFDRVDTNIHLNGTALDFFRSLNMTKSEEASFKRELMHYAVNNLVKITAYIESPYVSEYQTDEVMSTTTFIANIGGMLGLCMGFSFVTLVEIFYFLANVFLNMAGVTK